MRANVYQISIRRKAGASEEKVGAPFADHTEAVKAMEALLNERFPGRWQRNPTTPDVWSIDRTRGAKLMRCGLDGKPPVSETVSVNVRMSKATRDTLNAIARERGLMNPKHPDSPNISAAIEYLAGQYSTKD